MTVFVLDANGGADDVGGGPAMWLGDGTLVGIREIGTVDAGEGPGLSEPRVGDEVLGTAAVLADVDGSAGVDEATA